MKGQSLLVVDDDDVFRDRLARGFAERGFDVRAASDVAAAMALASEDAPELAVVDLRLGSASGLALVDGLRGLEPATRVVVLTGWGSVATAVDALRRGAVHYLQKPVDIDEILRALLGDDAEAVDDEAVDGAPTPSLARQEWEYIQRVMAECEGNVSAAARRLGLHRRSLQRKLQKRPPAR